MGKILLTGNKLTKLNNKFACRVFFEDNLLTFPRFIKTMVPILQWLKHYCLLTFYSSILKTCFFFVYFLRHGITM